MWTVAEEVPASIWRAMETASLIGIVNACVAVDELSWTDPLDAAVSMPITWPEALVRGPPASPAWVAALVRMSPDSCSAVPDAASVAVIDWLRPVTVPVATDGVPSWPPALPMATTLLPTATLDELPRFAVGRPDAPCSWITAMSWLPSEPPPDAGEGWPVPPAPTLMVAA